jgi:hypothetical protein
MRRYLVATALAGALLAGFGLPVGAQQNGIVIQNNGVDSSNSAAGADNVRISNSPGAGQASSGGGVNNETARAVREPKDRDRGERRAQNNAEGGGGEAAPVEAAAAPAEGDLQGFSEGGEYVEPATAPLEAPQPADAEPVTLQLPNTGTGVGQTLPLAVLAGLAAIFAGAGSQWRRLIRS